MLQAEEPQLPCPQAVLAAGSAVALALEARREVPDGLVLLRGDQVDDGRQHGRVPAPHRGPVHWVWVLDLLLEKIVKFLS